MATTTPTGADTATEGTYFFGLYTKVLLTLLILVFVPLAVLAWSTYGESAVKADVAAFDNLNSTADVFTERVDGFTGLVLSTLRHTAELPDIAALEEERATIVLDAVEASYDFAYLAFLVGRDGFLTARSKALPPRAADGERHYRGDRAYHLTAISGGLGVQTLVGRTTGQPAVCLATPVKQAGVSVPVAQLTLCNNLNLLTELFAQTRIGETGSAIVLDRDLRLVAHTRGQERGLEPLADMSAHPLAEFGGTRKVNRYSDNGTERVAVARSLDLGWRLIIEQDVSEVYGPLQSKRTTLIGIVIAAALFVLLVGILLARSMSQPLRELHAFAMRLAKGSVSDRAPHMDRADEVGDLARSMERMSVSIKLAVP